MVLNIYFLVIIKENGSQFDLVSLQEHLIMYSFKVKQDAVRDMKQ